MVAKLLGLGGSKYTRWLVSDSSLPAPQLAFQVLYDTIHYGGTSLGNLRVALACEPRRLIPYSLVSYPSHPLGD
jgi:hypothetical protein